MFLHNVILSEDAAVSDRPGLAIASRIRVEEPALSEAEGTPTYTVKFRARREEFSFCIPTLRKSQCVVNPRRLSNVEQTRRSRAAITHPILGHRFSGFAS
jgi:hypothetical protein